jgi:polyribonucleotide nucleotidyltransferase
MVTLGDLQDTLDQAIAKIQKDPILHRIWEESLAKQKAVDEQRRLEIINLLQKSIDNSIDSLKECARILETIKDETDSNLRILSLDKLQETCDKLISISRDQNTLVDELSEVIK